MTLGSTSTNGMYRGSVTVRSTQEYRSLFRGPSNEGVETDGSPAITISVSSACSGSACPQSTSPTR